MKRLLFIYNPHAGKGLIREHLLDVIDIFVKGGYEVSVYPTQGTADAQKKTREVEGQYDIISCCGGDGTLDEVVSGMMECKEKTPIGYIPAGSTNDYSNSLGLPSNMEKAAQIIVEGEMVSCDIGKFNNDYFVYIAAFGLFTDVSYQTSQEMKNILGHVAYVLEGVKSLTTVTAHELRIETKERVIEDEFLYGMVTNATSVGGFKNITPRDVWLDDGIFEVILIRRPKTLLGLQKIMHCLLTEEECPDVYSFRTDCMRITSKAPVSWTLDGEFGGEHTELEIKNCPRALDIIIEKDTKNLPVLEQ